MRTDHPKFGTEFETLNITLFRGVSPEGFEFSLLGLAKTQDSDFHVRTKRPSK